MSAGILNHRRAETVGFWTPLIALAGARRGPAFRPTKQDLRQRLRVHYLRRLRQDARSNTLTPE